MEKNQIINYVLAIGATIAILGLLVFLLVRQEPLFSPSLGTKLPDVSSLPYVTSIEKTTGPILQTFPGLERAREDPCAFCLDLYFVLIEICDSEYSECIDVCNSEYPNMPEDPDNPRHSEGYYNCLGLCSFQEGSCHRVADTFFYSCLAQHNCGGEENN